MPGFITGEELISLPVEQIREIADKDKWEFKPPVDPVQNLYGHLKPAFLALVARGIDNTPACKKLDVPVHQICIWARKDPKFKKSYAIALQSYSEISLDALKAYMIGLQNSGLEKIKGGNLIIQSLFRHHNYKRAYIPRVDKDYGTGLTSEKLKDVDRRLEQGIIEPDEALTEKKAIGQSNQVVSDETVLKLEKLLKEFEERDGRAPNAQTG